MEDAHAVDSSKGDGRSLQEPPMHELQEVAGAFDGLLQARAELIMEKMIVENDTASARWNVQLAERVKAVVRQTQQNWSPADSLSQQRAIMLQTKADLLSIGLGGTAILLQDLNLGSAANVAKILQTQHINEMAGWRKLIEDQAEHAEAQVARLQLRLLEKVRECEEAKASLKRKAAENETWQEALADLLAASSQLKRDSAALVKENQALQAELNNLSLSSQGSTVRGSVQSEVLEPNAAPGRNAQPPASGAEAEAALAPKTHRPGQEPRPMSYSPTSQGTAHSNDRSNDIQASCSNVCAPAVPSCRPGSETATAPSANEPVMSEMPSDSAPIESSGRKHHQGSEGQPALSEACAEKVGTKGLEKGKSEEEPEAVRHIQVKANKAVYARTRFDVREIMDEVRTRAPAKVDGDQEGACQPQVSEQTLQLKKDSVAHADASQKGRGAQSASPARQRYVSSLIAHRSTNRARSCSPLGRRIPSNTSPNPALSSAPPKQRQTSISGSGEVRHQAEEGGAAARQISSSTFQKRRRRVLPLKQVQAIVAEVSASKRRAESGGLAAGARRQTMAEHLDDFLAIKFGLPEIIAEWQGAIEEGLKSYQHVDAHVGLFRKVVHNKVEESFIVELAELEECVKTALKMTLTKKYGFEAGSESLENAVQHRSNGAVPADEWLAILSTILNGREAADVANAIRQLHPAASSPTELSSLAPEGCIRAQTWAAAAQDHDVEFRLVMQILLHRHVRCHEKALAPMLTAFQAFDNDCRGVLDKEAFHSFCRSINNAISDREVLILLNAMDPGGAGIVTFSSCATVLSTELERIAQS